MGDSRIAGGLCICHLGDYLHRGACGGGVVLATGHRRGTCRGPHHCYSGLGCGQCCTVHVVFGIPALGFEQAVVVDAPPRNHGGVSPRKPDGVGRSNHSRRCDLLGRRLAPLPASRLDDGGDPRQHERLDRLLQARTKSGPGSGSPVRLLCGGIGHDLPLLGVADSNRGSGVGPKCCKQRHSSGRRRYSRGKCCSFQCRYGREGTRRRVALWGACPRARHALRDRRQCLSGGGSEKHSNLTERAPSKARNRQSFFCFFGGWAGCSRYRYSAPCSVSPSLALDLENV
mmetsp:Transcript_21490/g.62625  ORF Transcript_21490/g.62625 Transcript_21490/m.62625 type:complete len:286 (-) Transcript_21490:77-934(-)